MPEGSKKDTSRIFFPFTVSNSIPLIYLELDLPVKFMMAALFSTDNTTDEDGSSKGGVTAPKATFPHPKAEVTKENEDKKSQYTKGKPPSSSVGTDVPKFSFEPKQETESVSSVALSCTLIFKIPLLLFFLV